MARERGVLGWVAPAKASSHSRPYSQGACSPADSTGYLPNANFAFKANGSRLSLSGSCTRRALSASPRTLATHVVPIRGAPAIRRGTSSLRSVTRGGRWLHSPRRFRGCSRLGSLRSSHDQHTGWWPKAPARVGRVGSFHAGFGCWTLETGTAVRHPSNKHRLAGAPRAQGHSRAAHPSTHACASSSQGSSSLLPPRPLERRRATLGFTRAIAALPSDVRSPAATARP